MPSKRRRYALQLPTLNQPKAKRFKMKHRDIRTKLYEEDSVNQEQYKTIYLAIQSSHLCQTQEIPGDLIQNIAEFASGIVKCWNYKHCSNTISPSEYDSESMSQGTDDQGWDVMNEYIFTIDSIHKQANKYITEYGYFYYNGNHFCSDCVNKRGTSLGLEFCSVCDHLKVVIWNGEQCRCGHFLSYCNECTVDTKCIQCGIVMCHWSDTHRNEQEFEHIGECPQHCDCDLDFEESEESED